MADQNESHAVGEVVRRLAEQFPDLDADEVSREVAAAHTLMTGPIRDFVPVMVERVARDRLASRRGSGGATLGT